MNDETKKELTEAEIEAQEKERLRNEPVKVRNLGSRPLMYGSIAKVLPNETKEVARFIAEIWKSNFPKDVLVGEDIKPEVLDKKNKDIADLKAQLKDENAKNIELTKKIAELEAGDDSAGKLKDAEALIADQAEKIKKRDDIIAEKDAQINNLNGKVTELENKVAELRAGGDSNDEGAVSDEPEKTPEELEKEKRKALFAEAKELGVTHSNAISTADLEAKIADKKAGK